MFELWHDDDDGGDTMTVTTNVLLANVGGVCRLKTRKPRKRNGISTVCVCVYCSDITAMTGGHDSRKDDDDDDEERKR